MLRLAKVHFCRCCDVLGVINIVHMGDIFLFNFSELYLVDQIQEVVVWFCFLSVLWFLFRSFDFEQRCML